LLYVIGLFTDWVPTSQSTQSRLYKG